MSDEHRKRVEDFLERFEEERRVWREAWEGSDSVLSRLDRIEARLDALESSIDRHEGRIDYLYDMRDEDQMAESAHSPTDSAVPDSDEQTEHEEYADIVLSPPTEGPKVVGWIEVDKAPGRRPMILQSEHEAVVRGLREEVTRLENLRDRLKVETEIHAGEARTANSTINEIYQVVSGARGEPGNWHGAEPVRAEIARLKAENERLRRDLMDWQKRWESACMDLNKARGETDRLRAERDAYADPKNWMPLSARYIGPTPSDSTEPESVEGEVEYSEFGEGVIKYDGASSDWPIGTRVKITRLPETGGNDGD